MFTAAPSTQPLTGPSMLKAECRDHLYIQRFKNGRSNVQNKSARFAFNNTTGSLYEEQIKSIYF